MAPEGLDAALKRSNFMSEKPANWSEILDAAVGFVPQYSNRIAEVSKTGLHKFPDGERLGTDEAFLFLFPDHFAIAQARGAFKKRIDVQGDMYRDGEVKGVTPDEKVYARDGKAGEFALQFYGPGQVAIVRLAWTWFRRTFTTAQAVMLPAAKERDRIRDALAKLGL